MRASNVVFRKMSAMGILKTKYIFTTRVLYAKLAGRFSIRLQSIVITGLRRSNTQSNTIDG